ncbi:MAG: beta-lactamase family protein [Rhodobacterales bacterium]|nr:beta-lactamase family protein [Rhodobacterales bacterium]
MTGPVADPAALIRSLVPPFAFAGLAFARPGAAACFHIATAPGLTATPDTLWRAASISKIVTGRTLRAACPAAETPAEELLGLPFRNPATGQPVTLAQIATHTSGLSDAAGYLVPQGMSLADWLAGQGAAIWAGTPPGAGWDYCNLGYLILAACAEVASGRPFDALAQEAVIGPAGITAGFNWAGVAARHNHIATFRRDGTRLLPQIDAVVAPQGISGPDGREVPRPPFTAGVHVAQFSPQGGLRLSLHGALTLAQGLTLLPDEPLWHNPAPATQDNPFAAQGWGLQVLAPGDHYPRQLVGHFANAYGMCGGVWHDRLTGGAFAYVLNGLPRADESDALRPEELAILATMAQALG